MVQDGWSQYLRSFLVKASAAVLFNCHRDRGSEVGENPAAVGYVCGNTGYHRPPEVPSKHNGFERDGRIAQTIALGAIYGGPNLLTLLVAVFPGFATMRPGCFNALETQVRGSDSRNLKRTF